MRSTERLLLLVALGAAGAWPVGRALAAERSLPLDCLPDQVAEWRAAGPDPEARHGADNLPGIVLGPPGPSLATTGSTTVASLGPAGAMVYHWIDMEIEDRPGPDFIVFENAFFVGAAPTGPEEDYTIFAEPAFVEVSSDGQSWYRFPYDAQALDAARGGNIDRQQHLALRGLAGITPTFSGNWTVPDDPEVWDPAGQGGVSGAGGDAFDLADVGLARARWVRLIDAESNNGFPGAGEGFDLDAVVVLHGRPLASTAADADGDRLSDLVEQRLVGSDSGLADSDGDGTDDGREVAGCRDPLSIGEEPWWQVEPHLWIERRGETDRLRWTWTGADDLYDLLASPLEQIVDAGEWIDLGPGQCLGQEVAGVRLDLVEGAPAAGKVRTYHVRLMGTVAWGRSSDLEQRESGAGCP